MTLHATIAAPEEKNWLTYGARRRIGVFGVD